ncbi:MAG: hypothetical protein KGL39_24265 [Patescibacteria group bacterium]|nr:hypothetical protein [Patescibacteria group bacterium]
MGYKANLLDGDKVSVEAEMGMRNPRSMSAAITAEMVKGVGYARGGTKPVEDVNVLAPLVYEAFKAFNEAISEGFTAPADVLKRASAEVGPFLQGALASNPAAALAMRVAAMEAAMKGAMPDAMKDITTTGPLASGFVPFDLERPAKLIFPVFSPLRNKFARPGGQGTSRRSKIITAIAGSGTGQAPVRISIGEFPGGGSFSSNWPSQLPPSSSESAQDLNVPYRFMGHSKQVSWLAQFAGRGFEDVTGLATLLLLQEMMLGEEYMLLSGSNTNVSAPTIVSAVSRAATGTETGLSGVTTDVYVVVTATNSFGETAASAVTTVATSNGAVIDVTIGAPRGGPLQYNIYVSTGASDPGTHHLMASGIGGTKYTLQGAIPTTGNTPPGADSGTGNTNDYDGIFSILSGKAAGGTYPAGSQGGYYLANVQATLGHAVLNPAFQGLWDATKANPDEIVGNSHDIGNLSDEIRNSASTEGYRIMITSAEQAAVLAGAAVSSYVNPATRKEVAIMVHPWLPQGNLFINSNQIPVPHAETANVWENVMVQDYMSVAWPVIDATYRFSAFQFGALVNYAPIYCGCLQGLQKSISNSGSTYA